MDVLPSRFLQWTKPLSTSLLLETLADLGRSKSQLIAENVLLRQQLIILHRQVKRPACSKADRTLLVLLARSVRTWVQAPFIVQPDTLLTLTSGAFSPGLEAQVKGRFSHGEDRCRNHRIDQGDGSDESALGAERIRGELLKLGMHVCKRTIQKYMRHVHAPRPGGSSKLLMNQIDEIILWHSER